ncbi:ATP-grasp domain-containing protein [Falsiroseomonas selenitidurans]|uniref:Alpha-L-glutamate ligase n=1 Tax=Falsiroseomonas selenitidurans TaxID=2716335 RepID=A0ABX1DZ55_9PROT|nr:alpha-L-glutamate ligase [Falsiroseomonas selenitidurans]NKC29655.1 alpha-L-glutamate ligase [Falsiroseomonas selenitidurans]
MTKVHVIHENDAWVEPLRQAFATLGTPYEEWFLDRGVLDLTQAPPAGIFYNRMSASSHTRGHVYAPEYAGAVIEVLERHKRSLVNGRRALQLELSKVAQYQALAIHGIPVPATLAVVGRENIPEAAAKLGYPLILKHNRAGKGLGVRLLRSEPALREALALLDVTEDQEAHPRDGIWLVQRYIEAAEPCITRAEFVGGRFLYAVRVDTSEGFELCPADACAIGDGAACPAVAPGQKFIIQEGFQHPLIHRMEAFLLANGIGVGAIEFITDAAGNSFAYDVNTNTNYNAEAEARAGRSGAQTGMGAIAAHLTALLRRESLAAAA